MTDSNKPSQKSLEDIEEIDKNFAGVREMASKG
jgi:hypothetical protein